MNDLDLQKIEKIILRKLRSRSSSKTMCPSEVLPLDLKQNKVLMEQVRLAARALAKKGDIVITQKGKRVNPDRIHGPIRLRLSARRHRMRDTRLFPEDYRVAKGEQGVLTNEPYKSEILPYWRFKTPEAAKISAQKIYAMFEDYLRREDFVGMDMARKFIQMGGTRARRYANHASGRKYASDGEVLAPVPDQSKAQAAAVFFEYLKKIETSQPYADLKVLWRCALG